MNETGRYSGDPERRFAIGETAKGFRFKRAMRIPGGAGSAYEFEHVGSGAHWLHLETDEARNSFQVAFRTPVSDDTGVPHVLEHLVLCGSAKYPVQDAFEQVQQRTLISESNAETFEEFTWYYFDSVVESEYFKVADYFLDSVFHPLLTEDSFRREAWRLSEDAGGNGDLSITGIVYNEVKKDWNGIMAERLLFGRILPDSSFSHWSGGRPSSLLELTNERVREYHRTWYRPENAYILTRGKIGLERIREFLSAALADFVRGEMTFPSCIAAVRDGSVVREEVSVEGCGTAKECVAWHFPYEAGRREQLLLDLALRAARPGDERKPKALEGDFSWAGSGDESLLVYCRDWGRFFDRSQRAEYEKVRSLLETAVADESFRKAIVDQAKQDLEASIVDSDTDEVVDYAQIFRCWIFQGNPLNALSLLEARLALFEVQCDPEIAVKLIKEVVLESKSCVDIVFTGNVEKCHETNEAERRKTAALSAAEKTAAIERDRRLRESQRTDGRPEAEGLPLTRLEEVPSGAWLPEFRESEEADSGVKIVRIGGDARGRGYGAVFVDCGDFDGFEWALLDMWCSGTKQSNFIRPERRPVVGRFGRFRRERAGRFGSRDGIFECFSLRPTEGIKALESCVEALSQRDLILYDRMHDLVEGAMEGPSQDDGEFEVLVREKAREGLTVNELTDSLIEVAAEVANKLHNPARWTFIFHGPDGVVAKCGEWLKKRCRSIPRAECRAGLLVELPELPRLSLRNEDHRVSVGRRDDTVDRKVHVTIPIDDSLADRIGEIRIGADILSDCFAHVVFRERAGAYVAYCQVDEGLQTRTLTLVSERVGDVGYVMKAILEDLVPFVERFPWGESGRSDGKFKDAVRAMAMKRVLRSTKTSGVSTGWFRDVAESYLVGETGDGLKQQYLEMLDGHPQKVKEVMLELLGKGLPRATVSVHAPTAALEKANRVLPEEYQFPLEEKRPPERPGDDLLAGRIEL